MAFVDDVSAYNDPGSSSHAGVIQLPAGHTLLTARAQIGGYAAGTRNRGGVIGTILSGPTTNQSFLNGPEDTDSVVTHDSGTATSGATRTLTDTSKSWTAGEHVLGRRVNITSGTGSGQSRRISANTATALTVDRIWTTIPDSSSVYAITDTRDTLMLFGIANCQIRDFELIHRSTNEADAAIVLWAHNISSLPMPQSFLQRVKLYPGTNGKGIGILISGQDRNDQTDDALLSGVRLRNFSVCAINDSDQSVAQGMDMCHYGYHDCGYDHRRGEMTITRGNFVCQGTTGLYDPPAAVRLQSNGGNGAHGRFISVGATMELHAGSLGYQTYGSNLDGPSHPIILQGDRFLATQPTQTVIDVASRAGVILDGLVFGETSGGADGVSIVKVRGPLEVRSPFTYSGRTVRFEHTMDGVHWRYSNDGKKWRGTP